MEVTKEVLFWLISVALLLKDYVVVQLLGGKCFHLAEVESALFFEKEKYCIIGAGVIEVEILKSSLEDKNADFIKHIIPIRNKEEQDLFLGHIASEKEKKSQALENIESSIDEKISETIKKYITDEEQQEKAFSLVKESSGLSGEELLCKMDIVYKMVKSQQNLTAIFKANPKVKINKNTYSVKERNLGGNLDE